MSDLFGTAAEWLEHGRPSERPVLAEADRYGDPLWTAGGVRAYEQQASDTYRLTLVGGASPVTYEIAGLDDGRCLR